MGIEIPKLKVATFEYGERFGDSGLELIHSPGHTIGSIVLYDRATKSLFSGDTVFANGGVGRWDLETGNLGQLRESITKIEELGLENLYPGHGPAIEGGASEHVRMSLDSLGGWVQ
jgi:glyoxylase-like metal-dependent hydrolase (beta-lactamase superfamily II)